MNVGVTYISDLKDKTKNHKIKTILKSRQKHIKRGWTVYFLADILQFEVTFSACLLFHNNFQH